MIVRLPSSLSTAAENEIRAHAEECEQRATDIRAITSLRQFLAPFCASASGQELMERVGSVGAQLRVLDIGPGLGESTLYLASRGYAVSCVEPSPDQCEAIATLARRFGLDVTIYQATAEAMDAIGAAMFDLCVFNASLHHCDEPIRALQNARELLIPSGTLLVLNEAFLRRYRTKEWFQRMLIEQPLRMGHYGGNEHTYYYGEYRSMLHEAGFRLVRDHLHVRNKRPRSSLDEMIHREVGGRPVYSDASLMVRAVWFFVLAATTRIPVAAPLLLGVLKRLSLITVSFEAHR